MKRQVVAGEYSRPDRGYAWSAPDDVVLPVTGGRGWQSNGGATRGHPARMLPHTLEVPIPEVGGELVRVVLLGHFALWASRSIEAEGTLGAAVHLTEHRQLRHHVNLLSGLHYHESSSTEWVAKDLGDGVQARKISNATTSEGLLRVDAVSLDVPAGVVADRLLFKDFGTPASFVLFDVFFEFEEKPKCPFRSTTPGYSLGEVGAIVRIGDRSRLRKAFDMAVEGIESTGQDLDEARGLALTFLGVVCAALLEVGAERSLHRFQLESARSLDDSHSVPAIVQVLSERLERLIGEPVVAAQQLARDPLIDRAVQWIDRNFAREVSDQTIAQTLGLSTSHFRYLFRRETGQPFSRYLLAVRLEKAREMLAALDMSVAEIAHTVGFRSPAHFSRAFVSRFGVSPSALRRPGASED